VEDLGQRLPYKALSVLGEGSHGTVLLVEHKRLGKRFVLKLIQQKFLTNRDVVGRFVAEAQRGAKLDHEAFAPIVDLGETDDGRTYFVMEYVEGVTLQQALRSRSYFSIEEAFDLAVQLLDGLAAAHDALLIHRDIKPANLFVTARGRLKILDLGISKSILDTGTGPNTAAGVAIGTPKYMSPEQATGRAVTFSTDVYAVGLVLFEMLAGAPAFDGVSTHELLRHQLYTQPPTLAARAGRRFPPSVEDVVARALVKEPLGRFQTAREMIAALRSALSSNEAIVAPPAADSTIAETSRPTVKMDGPPPADAFATGYQPTGSVGATGKSSSVSTRPIAPNALVLGMASTSPQAIIEHASHDIATARTEALPALTDSGANETGGATTRTQDDQRILAGGTTLPRASTESRTLLTAAAIIGSVAVVLASVALLVFVLRGPREPAALPTPASASPTPAAVAVATTVAAPAPSTSTSPVSSANPSPSVSASVLNPVIAPPAAKAKPGHYQAAVDALNAGELETADSEARLAVAQGGGTQARLLLAQVLERRGKKAAAREVYQQILDKDPTMAAAVAGLKRCGG